MALSFPLRKDRLRLLPRDHPVAAAWHRFWRQVSHMMPKRIYARSLIIVIAPNRRKMAIAVMIARTKMRFRAVAKTRSTASEKRLVSRPCCPNA